jgi:hypothetical protein
MFQKVLQQRGAAQYKRTDTLFAHRNGYKTEPLKPSTGKRSSRNPNSENFRLRYKSLDGNLGREILMNAIVELHHQER